VSRARKITPIVFWASCRPWPSAIAAAETVCACRNPRLTLCGLRLRNAHMIPSISANAARKPNSGEATIGITTLSRMTPHSTNEPEATAAPTRPPIRACDEEDGSPKYQVTRFHEMAPMRPAITTTSPCVPGSGEMTLPTVSATS
jgi:hypothetical protein